MAMDEAKYQKIKSQMDAIDDRIMQILYQDRGALETSEIANRLGISIDETERRLNKIKDLGLIGDWET